MPTHAAIPGAEGTEWRKPVRDSLLVMLAITFVISLMLGGYSSGFGDPKPRDVPVAVSGPPSVVAQLDHSAALRARSATSAADARRLIEDRKVYGAFVFTGARTVTLLVAGGSGRSVAVALTGIAQGLAQQGKLRLQVQDVAPLERDDPSGAVEFYCVVFLAVGAALGATMLGRVLGAVRDVAHLGRRLLAMVLLSALLSLAAVTLADAVFGAVPGHPGQLYLALWGYSVAICLACSGVSALFGSLAGIALTLAFTVLGNTSAGGAVGRPLLNPFFSTVNPIMPHGAGIDVVRGVQYFDGRGNGQGVVCLVAWGVIGLALHLVFAIRRGKQTASAGRHEPETKTVPTGIGSLTHPVGVGPHRPLPPGRTRDQVVVAAAHPLSTRPD